MKRVLTATLLVTLLAVPAWASGSPSTGTGSTGSTGSLPVAALAAEPVLPEPAAWHGSAAFPRTAGTGRSTGGSLLWTDYLYDDHGTTGVPGGNVAETGVPSFGTYTYAASQAHGNGADIFRAGIDLGERATTWRVDWTTLADPAVPIAVWALDTDGDASTGGSAWPAGAGVRSPGVERFLVVSGRAAVLLDGASGAVLRRFTPAVDRASRSFVVTVPRSVLPVSGRWRVRLAAGVADVAGSGFARPGNSLPNQPAVYNVAFRTPEQEVPTNNFWNDMAQTRALLTGDVSPFGLDVDWAALAAHHTTPERVRSGWNVRWYTSSVELGAGRLTAPETLNDREPNYLGRVQPYAVYVPKGYRPGSPTPVTWLLHSLTQNHNQYAATTPKFTQQACEDRRSLCVTTLGRGPDGYYQGSAELDLWEVWGRVAQAYSVDAERTVVAGYSMGGFAANTLSQEHPDLFAAAVSLAGATGAQPALENVREVPVYLGHGAADELVPVRQAIDEADRLDALGYRYRFQLHPAGDHVAYELQDGFSDAAAWMGDRHRSRTPARVTFRWTPSREQTRSAPGVTGAYWLQELHGRAGVREARVDAVSGGRPERGVVLRRTSSVAAPGDPSPALVRQLTWDRGAAARPVRRLVLDLRGTASLTVRLVDAGLVGSAPYRLETTSDGPVRVRLVGARGERTVTLAAGKAVRTLRP